MIEELAALRIAPGEKLILKLPPQADFSESEMELLNEALRQVGLEGRVLVIIGEAEFVKLEQE